jgi:hypothetical protein
MWSHWRFCSPQSESLAPIGGGQPLISGREQIVLGLACEGEQSIFRRLVWLDRAVAKNVMNAHAAPCESAANEQEAMAVKGVVFGA